jgi:hypothetical protein
MLINSSIERTKLKKQAAHLFLQSVKRDKNLIEGYLGYIHLSKYGKMSEQEYNKFLKRYQNLASDYMLKRYGRLAAGDLLDIEYEAECKI